MYIMDFLYKMFCKTVRNGKGISKFKLKNNSRQTGKLMALMRQKAIIIVHNDVSTSKSL